jgi:hypothetical protein
LIRQARSSSIWSIADNLSAQCLVSHSVLYEMILYHWEIISRESIAMRNSLPKSWNKKCVISLDGIYFTYRKLHTLCRSWTFDHTYNVQQCISFVLFYPWDNYDSSCRLLSSDHQRMEHLSIRNERQSITELYVSSTLGCL